MDIEKAKTFQCPMELSMAIIGGKYKGVIIWHLIDNKLRYSELQKVVPKATPKMLSQQLKELEADGIVQRKLYPVVPPKTEYSLTELGKTIVPIILELEKWGDKYFELLGLQNPCNVKENKN